MRKFLVLFSVCLVFGCNGTSNPVDAASVGDSGGNDASVGDSGGNDASANDAGSDAGPIACSATTCTGAHACLRNVCVATCGADTTGFDTALASGLVVLGSVCRSPAALAFVGDHAYELTSATVGMVTTFTLSRWSRGSEAPTVTTVATATYTAAAAGTMVFAGGYVAVSADEMRAVFGYTTTLAGAVGGVFDVATGTGVATQVAADGNYDATFGDATHYFVDGALGGMQGLYRATSGTATFTEVVSHLGDFSGSVEIWQDHGVALAGGTSFGSAWADGTTTGDRVLVLDPAALASATTPIDGRTVQQLDMPSSFELLSGGRAASVHWGTSGVDAIHVRTLTRATSGTVTAAAVVNLTTGGAFTSVAAAGSDVALGFEGGLLFVH